MSFDVTKPVFTDNTASDIGAVRANFEMIRRAWMQGGVVPIDGATATYSYDGSGNLSTITYGGTLSGTGTFTYTSGNLTQEVWSLYSSTITVTYTYSGNNLASWSVAVT